MAVTTVTARVGSLNRPVAPRHARTNAIMAVADPAATWSGVTYFVLFFVPAGEALGPHGLRLSPFNVLGLIALLTWICYFFARRQSDPYFNPVRWLLLTGLAFQIIALAAAYRYPLSTSEVSGGQRSLVQYLSVLGAGLLLIDGVRTRDGIYRLFHYTLIGGYFSALVGMGQRILHYDVARLWTHVPFLYSAKDAEDSNGLLTGRALGTGTHPIEFSVTCACLIPVALAAMRFAPSDRWRNFHRVGAGVLLIGSLLGVSRAGFIGVVLAVILSVNHFTARQRVNAAGFGFIVLVFVQFGSHGTLSTLRYQLLNAGTDASSKGRTSDYGPVFAQIKTVVLQGIGTGRYNPFQNRFLDNAWLGTLLTAGVLGVTALGVQILVCLYLAGKLRREMRDPYLATLSLSLGAMLLVLSVDAYFFDEFSFHQSFGMFYLATAGLGAVYTLYHRDRSSVDV